jgi:hypothetical protein
MWFITSCTSSLRSGVDADLGAGWDADEGDVERSVCGCAVMMRPVVSVSVWVWIDGGLTLQVADDIKAYEEKTKASRPWVFAEIHA